MKIQQLANGQWSAITDALLGSDDYNDYVAAVSNILTQVVDADRPAPAKGKEPVPPTVFELNEVQDFSRAVHSTVMKAVKNYRPLGQTYFHFDEFAHILYVTRSTGFKERFADVSVENWKEIEADLESSLHPDHDRYVTEYLYRLYRQDTIWD